MTVKKKRSTRRKLTCPVRGCQGNRYPDQLMCRQHWFEVPIELRTKVVRLNLLAKGTKEQRSACYQALRIAGRAARGSKPR